jgi:hypothetical protein
MSLNMESAGLGPAESHPPPPRSSLVLPGVPPKAPKEDGCAASSAFRPAACRGARLPDAIAGIHRRDVERGHSAICVTPPNRC